MRRPSMPNVIRTRVLFWVRGDRRRGTAVRGSAQLCATADRQGPQRWLRLQGPGGGQASVAVVHRDRARSAGVGEPVSRQGLRRVVAIRAKRPDQNDVASTRGRQAAAPVLTGSTGLTQSTAHHGKPDASCAKPGSITSSVAAAAPVTTIAADDEQHRGRPCQERPDGCPIRCIMSLRRDGPRHRAL